MTSPSRAVVFETIAGQLREHKIVTFKWLSRTLRLHNTLAREYLEEWTKDCSKEDYIISYTVFGRKDDGELSLILTTDIFDDHFSPRNVTIIKKYVYSIQSSDTSFEPSLIYDIDKSTYELQRMSLSSINYHTEIIRKDPKAVSASALPNGAKASVGYSQHGIRRISPRKGDNGQINKVVDETSQQKNGHKESTNSCKTSLGGSCSGIVSEIAHERDSMKDVNIMKQISSRKPKTTKSGVTGHPITNFFDKNAAKKRTKDEPEEIKTDYLNTVVNDSDVLVNIEKLDPMCVENVCTKECEKGSAAKTRIKTQKNRKSNKKASRKVKQLKRILTPLDSDSDEEFSESDTSINDDEVLETAAEPVAVEEPEPEPCVIATGGKKMKRKIIEEEGEEDGFMVTIKKVVLETCESEDELRESSAVERPTQNTAPPQKKPKTELLTKKKQSSILSFFQKPKVSKV